LVPSALDHVLPLARPARRLKKEPAPIEIGAGVVPARGEVQA
jgi:hypothetical protein